MSDQNVDLVRGAWKIVAEEGVKAALERFDEFFTDDTVWEDFPELPDHGTYVGREGLLEVDRHFREMWSEFTQHPVAFTDAGDDLVLGVVEIRSVGLGSGVPLDAPVYWVHELRDGKLARMRAFLTETQALEASGLPAS